MFAPVAEMVDAPGMIATVGPGSKPGFAGSNPVGGIKSEAEKASK